MPKPYTDHAPLPDIDPIDSRLLVGAYEADNEFALQALEQGANVNAAEPESGLTALHIAVGTNNLPLVKELVENWDAQFTRDRQGRWPSYIAADCDVSDELCEYLLDREVAALSS